MSTNEIEKDMIQQRVTKGELTQEEADQQKAAIDEADAPGGGGGTAAANAG